MNVEKNKVVSLDYTLKDSDGETLGSSQGKEPLTYLHGAGNIIPGLEVALSGKAAGDSVSVVIEPENGYGQRDESQVAKIPRENLQGVEDLAIGMQLEAKSPSGTRLVNVVDLDKDTVTIDGNHPLAGMTLHFDLQVNDVRDATLEEVQHGHAHTEGSSAH